MQFTIISWTFVGEGLTLLQSHKMFSAKHDCILNFIKNVDKIIAIDNYDILLRQHSPINSIM